MRSTDRRSACHRTLANLLWLLIVGFAFSGCSSPPEAPTTPPPPAKLLDVPRIWNDRDLAEWANPVAGLGVRPDHFSEAEFYAGPVAEWVRTYPVYFPGREPQGYWERLQHTKPEPLITPGPRSEEDWIRAGQRVFEEIDVPIFRTQDAGLIATVRSREAFEKMGGHPQPDGTVHFLRWVPTAKGLTLGVHDCASCHTRQLPDGTHLNGAPFDAAGDGAGGGDGRGVADERADSEHRLLLLFGAHHSWGKDRAVARVDAAAACSHRAAAD